MHSNILGITKNDITSSFRGIISHLRTHLLTTLFSVLLIIPFIAAITGIGIFLFTQETSLSDMVHLNDVFITVLLISSGRAVSKSLNSVYRSGDTDFLRIMPIENSQIYRGKFLSVIMQTMISFSLFYGCFLFFFFLLYDEPLSFLYYLKFTVFFYEIAFFGSIMGFGIALLYHLSWEERKKISFVLAPVIFGGIIFLMLPINYYDSKLIINTLVSFDIITFALITFLVLTFVLNSVILNIDDYFSKAMFRQKHIKLNEHYTLPMLLSFVRFFDFLKFGPKEEQKHRNIMAAKEFLSTLRDSYFHIYAGMTILLIIIGIFVIETIPKELLDSDWGWLVYPVIVSFFLYIEGAFMVTLGSISLIGKEGKRLWVLKSLPVSGYDVLSGKSLSVIIPSVVGGFTLIIPLLYLTKLPAGQNLIFLVITLCVIFSFSGIGIQAGVRYPNFREGSKGSPEIVFQLFILFLCLFIIGFVIVPPMIFYYNYGWIPGLIIAVFVLIFSYSMFISGVRTGEKMFNRLSSSTYEKG